MQKMRVSSQRQVSSRMMYKEGFMLGNTDADDFPCFVNVKIKGKIPARCKVGATATVTGRVYYFLLSNDIVDAKATCRR